MKFNIIINFEKAKKVLDKDEYELKPGERFGTWTDDDGDTHDIVIVKADPCSTKINNINTSNIYDTLIRIGGLLEYKVETIAKQVDSEWFVYKFLNIILQGFTIRAESGSSYIPTPEKYNNSRCGLINIQNDDNECFKWCMKYHQAKTREKHCDRISVLKKVEDKYE